jgi:stage II sporulation protein D
MCGLGERGIALPGNGSAAGVVVDHLGEREGEDVRRRYLPLVVATVVPLQITTISSVVDRPPTGELAAGGSSPGATGCPAPGGMAVAPVSAVSGKGIVIQGHGWGHGLGMSQYGAQGAARLGCTRTQILAAYYAGTRLARSAMTAPVELALLGAARRSTVNAETSAVTWAAAGRTVTQPRFSTWTVTTSAGRTTLTSSTGARVLQVAAGGTLQARHTGAVVRLRSFTSASSSALSAADLRLRWGTVTFTASSASAAVSETITGDTRASAVDRYLWGLGEMPASWPREALRAQADAARTYLTHAYDSRKRRYVIGVTTAAQAYRGADQEEVDSRVGKPWHSAVTATHDEVIVDSRGRPIWALYSSSDGGRAESRAYVYGSQAGYGYLIGVDDSRWDLASDNPRRSWVKVLDPADLARRLGFASVSAVSIAAPGTAKRGDGLVVTGVRAGTTVTARFTGDQARAKLALASPVISVSWTAARPSAPAPAKPRPSSPAPSGRTSESTRVTGSYTSTACDGLACGRADARFSGARALIGVRETIQDRACDRRRAYVRLLVRYANGSSVLTTLRYAANRCQPPATVYSGLSWRAQRPIAGFAVVVGELGGRTVLGRYIDNPNT